MNRVMAIVLVVAMCSGCASVSYGPFSSKTLGKDLQLNSVQWVKQLPDGSKEVISVGAGANSSAEATHAVGNIVTAALGAIAGGAPGAAAGFGGAEVWQTFKDWLDKPDAKPSTPVETPSVPVVNAVYNDAPGVELSVRLAGREIANDGRATYLGGVLTTRPKDGWRNVCVQHNDLQAGEVTDWKDMSNNVERKDVIKNTNKVVAWFEK